MSSYSNYLASKQCCLNNISKPTTGAQGAQGSQGPIGPSGYQGVTGAQGATGAQGKDGAASARGDTGSQGVTGAQGVTGEQGVTGAQGAQGVTGLQGVTGPSIWIPMNGIGGYTGIGVTGQDVLIYGNLLVSGIIDPTQLILSETSSNLSMSFDYLGNINIRGDGSSNFSFNNGVTTNSTPMSRIALLSQVLASAEIPPNATTLKLNDTLLLDAGIANQTTTITDGTAVLNMATTGGGDNPILTLNQNDTSAGVGSLRMFKNISTNGGILGEVSFQGKDNVGSQVEYAKIQSNITNSTTGNGNLRLSCRVSNVMTEIVRILGADSQIEFYRPLDINNNDIVSSTGDIELNATSSSGTGDILLNPKSTAFVKVSEDIQTDNKITTLTDTTGCSVDFVGGTPDERFTINKNRVELNYANLITSNSTQTIFNNYATDEAYFKQTYTDIVGVNTLETIIENDLTHHRIKLSETASGANTEITKDEIDVDDGGGNVAKLTATDLQFNSVSILPRRFYTGGFAFSVFGSPTGTIYNVGSITDMVAGTKWKVEASFLTTSTNSRNAITYLVQDTASSFVDVNSALSYSVGGIMTANTIDPLSLLGQYISFTDTFEVSVSAVGACSFILTGGTYDSSTWSGNCNVSIVLTYIP